ncbi:MAG TPA: DUF892 family protein [Anaerolineales bacterium]|jgi:ferritin-like metal-binding protein YciE
MTLNSLHDLYIDQLLDLYSAEQQLARAMPEFAEAASSPQLRSLLEHEVEEASAHMEKLATLLGEQGVDAGSKLCRGMQGLVQEGSEVLMLDGPSSTIDAAVILAVQKAQHYEIATCGGLLAYAEVLGYDDAASTLAVLLEEEHEADQSLTDLAEGGLLATGINERAENAES